MAAKRRTKLWNLVLDHAHGAPVAVEHVCAAVMSATGIDAAAVAVTLSASPRETIYASNPVAAELEELILTLGEGPGVDALTGGPVLVADLAATECLTRWPVFAPSAAQAGVCAMFALPLQIGAIRLGVLDLYGLQPGELDREQVADALMLADTACALLLDAGHDDTRHDDTGHDRMRTDGPWPERSGLRHPAVHQATGMITVQLDVTAAVALIRMRAYAYAHDRRLQDVATDVVARRLRFGPDTEGREVNDGS
jgi:hypothetical protein